MRVSRKALAFSFALALFSAGENLAQEPAYFAGMPAVRYQESENNYHWIHPCNLPADLSNQKPVPGDPALCWPVTIIPVQLNGARTSNPTAIVGTIVVSPKEFAFVPTPPAPNSPAAASPPLRFVAPEVILRHQSGQQFAFFSARGSVYQFIFRSFCAVCGPNLTQAPPNPNPAQLDGEYSELQDALVRFQSVDNRIRNVAAQYRIQVDPSNQPTLNDPFVAMGLYSKLNRTLESVCPASAQACLESYARFEECEATAHPVNCGSAPTCKAVCNLTSDQIRNQVKATTCTGRSSDSANLLPDWTPLLKNGEADPDQPVLAGTGRIVIPRSTPLPRREQSGAAFEVSGTRYDNCSVASGHHVAWIVSMGQMVTNNTPSVSGPNTGVLGGSGSPQGTSGLIQIAAGQMQQLKQVPPVYPPVAKAAHIQGTVVLHAIISKTGTVENLSVVSGPPLLQAAAVDAVRQWQYNPYLLDGQPVAVDTTINVNFTFGGQPPTVPMLKEVQPPPAPNPM